MPTSKASTFAIRTSHPTDQKYVRRQCHWGVSGGEPCTDEHAAAATPPQSLRLDG